MRFDLFIEPGLAEIKLFEIGGGLDGAAGDVVKCLFHSRGELLIDELRESRRINEIVLGNRTLTADTALRLAKAFGNSVQFWMGLQDEYEIREARHAIQGNLTK